MEERRGARMKDAARWGEVRRSEAGGVGDTRRRKRAQRQKDEDTSRTLTEKSDTINSMLSCSNCRW